MYTSERIINIRELEKKIQSARVGVLAVKKKAEAENDQSLVQAMDRIQQQLFECENFEFVLERRKVKE